jgi:serine/threonine-protein kinase RIO1
VPKLAGLVKSPDNGEIFGILEEFIPTDLEVLHTLRDVDPSTVAKTQRKKWASQVQEMVSLLHEIGVVWGDGKPHNVLVHKDTHDAWLIDFGGSWTHGWVDRDLMGTEQGDDQAVERIIKFLEI